MSKGPRSLLIKGADPISVAGRLAHLPGVSWVSVGYEFYDLQACMSRLSTLAGRYLERGGSFRVGVEVERSEKQEGDVLMESTSTLLKAIKGSRVDEKNPQVQFRVTMVNDRGGCGVQLREGSGGVPTSTRMRATCLVSGGYHSAVTAWMAALSGYSLSLVHARDDDESLRQVARLYAELSRRIDATNLSLEVLDGSGLPGDRLAAWLGTAGGEVFAGVHPECRGNGSMAILRRHPSVLFPILLIQEDEIRALYKSLGLAGKPTDRAPRLRVSGGRIRYTVKSFGGRESDQNGVLDSILA